MRLNIIYNKNRPLLNSILTGLFYFLFSWSLYFEESETEKLYIILMLFLPGLTFPIATCYFETSEIKYSYSEKLLHLILSTGIYFGNLWVFLTFFRGEGVRPSILYGLTGSLLFQIMTKYVLRKQITFTQIALTGILSGLSFWLYQLENEILGGLSFFLWTIINGQLLNYEYKKQYPDNIQDIESAS